MGNSRNKHYIAKGFSLVLIIALIYLIGYGIQRDKKISIMAKEILAEQKIVKKNAEIVEKKLLDKKVVDDKTTKYKTKNWMAIGDNTTFKNQYQKFVKQSCGFASVTTHAEPGIPLYLMDDKVTKELLKNIDVVTVFAGTNDFGSNRPLGSINDSTMVDTFYSDMKAVVENIQKIKPEAKLVFISSAYIGEEGFGFLENAVGNTLVDYIKAMKEVCVLYKVPVLDLYTNSGINKNNILEYSDDYVEPNMAGMELIGNKIGQFLNTL